MYTEKLKVAFDSTTAVVLTSAAVIKKFTFARPMILRKVAFAISTATVSSGGIVITAKKYPLIGSSANAVTLGTITIPGGTAAGLVYYKDMASAAKLVVGDELVFEVTTAAAGGGAAGAGTCLFDADDNPETSANNSDMVASA